MFKKIVIVAMVIMLSCLFGYQVYDNKRLNREIINCYIIEHLNNDYRTCYRQVLPKFKKKYNDYYLKLDYWIMATGISDPEITEMYQRLLNEEKASVDLLKNPDQRRILLEQIVNQTR